MTIDPMTGRPLPPPLALTDADRAALRLPPPRDEEPEELPYSTCGEGEPGTGCGDALLSEAEQRRGWCNPCNARRRARYNAAMARGSRP